VSLARRQRGKANEGWQPAEDGRRRTIAAFVASSVLASRLVFSGSCLGLKAC
jgi:hypothetical protein